MGTNHFQELVRVADGQGRCLPPRSFLFLDGFGGKRGWQARGGLMLQGMFYFHGFRSPRGGRARMARSKVEHGK